MLFPVSVHVPAPIVIDRVFELLDANDAHVRLNPFALKLLPVTVTSEVEEKLSARFHISVALTVDPNIRGHPKLFPALVIVLVAKRLKNVIVPVNETVIADTRVTDPYAFICDDPANVPVNQVKSILFTVVVAFTVVVPDPELALKNTFSPAGKLAPDAHPEVAAQLFVLFQFPSPPVTQYLPGRSLHPTLFDTNVLFTHAVQVAFHHAILSLRDI